jgi:hypothetical protein
MGTISLIFNWLQKKLRRFGLGRDKDKPIKELQLFDHVQSSEKAFEPVERGLEEIPLERIVGTVGRYYDFDSSFRPRRKDLQHNSRLQGIIKAMQEGKPMPPVSLYQIKDDFFIVDGHYRVTAARQQGFQTIQAKVLELLPGADTVENMLYLEKIDFRDKAGLAGVIELTEPHQFVHLERQIKAHQYYMQQHGGEPTFDYKQAAADWYRTIYRPLYVMIEASGLAGSFPNRSIDDLYLYISVHQWEMGKKREYGIGIDNLIPKSMEAFREKMAEYKAAEYPEMKREITFFVLLNVEGKYETQIADKLYQCEEIDEVHCVHGSIDIIVRATLKRDLLTSDAELINHFHSRVIRQLKGIKGSQTLIPGLSRVKPGGIAMEQK